MVSLRGLHGLCVRSGALLCLTLVTPWTVPHQTALSMGFPRQEYWSGLPFPIPGDLPDPGITPASPVAPALDGIDFHLVRIYSQTLHHGLGLQSEI